MNFTEYEKNPRSYAMSLVNEGIISWEQLAMNLLVSSSHDDIRTALDANELSPRFFDEFEEEDEEKNEDEIDELEEDDDE